MLSRHIRKSRDRAENIDKGQTTSQRYLKFKTTDTPMYIEKDRNNKNYTTSSGSDLLAIYKKPFITSAHTRDINLIQFPIIVVRLVSFISLFHRHVSRPKRHTDHR